MQNANFHAVFIGLPMIDHTKIFLAAISETSDDGNIWHLVASVEAPLVSPWPNPEERHGGRILLFREGGSKYEWNDCQFNVWRSTNGYPWRVYAEGDTVGIEFDTGFPGQTEAQTQHAMEGKEHIAPLAFTAQAGIVSS